jgi:hypothetical protein
MERTALRLATVGTLLAGGHGPPWPTLAAEFVYDSLIDDVVDVVPAKRKPVIVVRTDDDAQAFKGYTFTTRQVRLLIEFGVLTASTVKLQDGTEVPRIDWPRTDSGLEASLDMLEWQIFVALFGYSDWAEWWRGCGNFHGLQSYTSVPRFSPPERGAVRLAVRTISLLMQLPGECVPKLVKEYGPQYPSLLPPDLVTVITGLLNRSTGDFKKSIEELQRIIVRYGPLPIPTAPPLQRVWATVTQPLYESGSDFRVEAMWPIEQEAPFQATGLTAAPPSLGAPIITPEVTPIP